MINIIPAALILSTVFMAGYITGRYLFEHIDDDSWVHEADASHTPNNDGGNDV